MITETYVDVAFPLTGDSLPLDHGYALYGALSRVIPVLHEERGEAREGDTARASWAVHPVRGLRAGPGELRLDGSSLLKIRLPATRIADVLPLAGKGLEIDDHRVSVGLPRIHPLEPRAALRARFVTIKHHLSEPEDFAGAAREQLAKVSGLGMDPERISLDVGRRRVLQICSKRVVGFPVAVDGLDATASLALQVSGLGGRRHMGAGVFVPAGRRA